MGIWDPCPFGSPQICLNYIRSMSFGLPETLTDCSSFGVASTGALCLSGVFVSYSLKSSSWTYEVPKRMAHIPIVLG